ncbi:hypothetical protein BMS_0754 [Halobacteriovorax marinus SJ]|uniref:Uncharacterized protein n=1 Tax=Halobacteriovorax marinus (strain ATCC BAA-682 / DSM 15412 / SJ) TaxID=862908 RepID=E1X5U0_HALMS|nr:hypothetical protein [Halobacteriovorax marinus]CBW25657.1 hypothetical protein BMS_0754 [Halobacteriovorax marinus SJ]
MNNEIDALRSKWLYTINPVYHSSIPKGERQKLQLEEDDDSQEEITKYFNKVHLPPFHDPNISDGELRALIQIKGMSDNLEDGNFSSLNYMASLTAKTRATFKRAVRSLREKKYIYTFSRGSGSTNHYLVVDPDLRYLPYKGKLASHIHWNDWREMVKNKTIQEYYQKSLDYFEKNYAEGEEYLRSQVNSYTQDNFVPPLDQTCPFTQFDHFPTPEVKNVPQ